MHVFGVSNFQHVYRDHAGFLFDCEIEAGAVRIPLHTPTEWICRPAKAWRKDVVRLTIQMGFQEHFDADADPANWMSPEYEPTEADGWKTPEIALPATYHPHLHLESRGIPLLTAHEHQFASVVAQFRGENVRGYKITDDVYHFPLSETRKKDTELLENPSALLRRDEEVTTIHPPADGEFVAVTLDLGQYRTGHMQLDIVDAVGDEIIDIVYSEVLDKNKFPLIVGTSEEDATASQICTADRYRCRAGRKAGRRSGIAACSSPR